jgi:hypothetical protein
MGSIGEVRRHYCSQADEVVSSFHAGQEMADRAVAQIRIATPDDANALASMHVTSWRETYTGILPDKMLSSLSVEARAAAWVQIMREPATVGSTVIYLAEHEATIIGFGSCGAQRTETLKDKATTAKSAPFMS